jgi:hypothetical protein
MASKVVLAYKSEGISGQEGHNQDDSKLGAFSLWTRVLMCPIVVPCLFCFALCFGMEPSEQVLPDEGHEGHEGHGHGHSSGPHDHGEHDHDEGFSMLENILASMCPCCVERDGLPANLAHLPPTQLQLLQTQRRGSFTGQPSAVIGNSGPDQKAAADQSNRANLRPSFYGRRQTHVDREKALTELNFELATNIARTDKFVLNIAGSWQGNTFLPDAQSRRETVAHAKGRRISDVEDTDEDDEEKADENIPLLVSKTTTSESDSRAATAGDVPTRQPVVGKSWSMMAASGASRREGTGDVNSFTVNTDANYGYECLIATSRDEGENENRTYNMGDATVLIGAEVATLDVPNGPDDDSIIYVGPSYTQVGMEANKPVPKTELLNQGTVINHVEDPVHGSEGNTSTTVTVKPGGPVAHSETKNVSLNLVGNTAATKGAGNGPNHHTSASSDYMNMRIPTSATGAELSPIRRLGDVASAEVSTNDLPLDIGDKDEFGRPLFALRSHNQALKTNYLASTVPGPTVNCVYNKPRLYIHHRNGESSAQSYVDTLSLGGSLVDDDVSSTICLYEFI